MIRILLVEDNPGDVELMLESLRDQSGRYELSVTRDGAEALDFLRRQGPYTDAPRPDLIFLDLNLPRMNGHEVLAAIKADEHLRPIPVVVITTSRADRDVVTSYRLHANAYVTKPMDLPGFVQTVQRTASFWTETARLPNG
jgi:CheY-like chemotaxis protein